MGVGGLVLLGAALVAGQPLTVPTQPETITALGYLVVIGSAALFMMFLYIIERWTAWARSYSLLLMPLSAAVGGALLLGEPITVGLLAGGALIMLGVCIGAFAPSIAVPFPGLRRRPAAAAAAAASAATVPEDADEGPQLLNPGFP